VIRQESFWISENHLGDFRRCETSTHAGCRPPIGSSIPPGYSSIMPSKEFVDFSMAMASRPSPPAGESLAEQRARIDAAMSLLPARDDVKVEEVQLDGIPGLQCTSNAFSDFSPTVVYLHGGGFRIGSPLAYRSFAAHVAAFIGGRVIVPRYRLAPEDHYPAGLEDASRVWRHVAIRPELARRTVVAGDSAGGGLAASVALAHLESGPQPAGVACLSPWVDLTLTSETFESRASTDRLFSLGAALEARSMYLGSRSPEDPLVSPALGDWRGAPPFFVAAGDTEVLLGDSLRLAERITSDGGDVELHVFADMPHIWIVNHPAFPEATRGLELFASFVKRVTSRTPPA
jgi:monoterpene epsilon-lactone hydrolase